MSCREALSDGSRVVASLFGGVVQHKKPFLWLLVLAAAVLLVYGVGAAVLPYIVWRQLRHISDALALQSGVSPNLMLTLVVIATIPFFWAVWKYTGGVFKLRHVRPSLRLYSNGYGILIVCYVAAFFLAQFFAARHAYYSKWCAETPEGIKTFDAYGTGLDPTYGINLHHCTFAEIVALRRQQVPLATPKRIQLSDPDHFAFFDPVSGAPRVWYYMAGEGDYRLYDGPGRDSETGTALQPMDEQTRGALIEVEHQEQQQVAQATATELQARHDSFVNHYLNAGAPGSAGAKRAAVLIFEKSGVNLAAVDNYVLSQVSRYGLIPMHSLFRPAFASEGRAASLFDGDWSQARQIDLANHVKYLILGTAKISFTENGALEGVRTANLELHLKALDVSAQSVLDDATIGVAGAGFSQSAVLNNALVHAEPAARRAIGLAPRSPVAHNLLGIVEDQFGHPGAAEREYQAALEFDPKLLSARNNLGNLLLREGKLAQAKKQFEQVLQVDPNHAQAHYNLGTLLLATHDYQQAADQFSAVSQLRHEDQRPLLAFIDASLKAGKAQAAKQAGEEFARRNAKSARALFSLALVMAQNWQYEAAARYFEQVNQLRPHSFDTLYNLGVTLYNLNQLEPAAQALAEAADLNPQPADTHFRLGLIASQRGDHDNALIEFRHALARDPSNAQYQYMLGREYFRMGYWKGAAVAAGLVLRPNLVSALAKPLPEA